MPEKTGREPSFPWKPPTWSEPFHSSRLQQGCQAVFEGLVSAVPLAEISWRFCEEKLITGPETGRIVSYDETSGLVRLVIEDLGPGDEGSYHCRADNPYGDTTCTIVISPEVVGAKQRTATLPKGSCRMKLRACHIDSDDYADYARLL